jgi:hypothetical protein
MPKARDGRVKRETSERGLSSWIGEVSVFRCIGEVHQLADIGYGDLHLCKGDFTADATFWMSRKFIVRL